MLCWLPQDVCTQFDFGPVEHLREAYAELSELIVSAHEAFEGLIAD
jgi:hypothetical protein